MAEPAIVARRLFVVHHAATGNVVALQGLSLEVEPGEFVALVGPSGSGKSTLMRCLAGRQRPVAGELSCFGWRLHDADPRSLARFRTETVGFVAQHYARALSPDLSAVEIVAMQAMLRGARPRAARRRAHELLDAMALADRAGARRTELSGGQQQRVALAAALSAGPRLLLADEVTGELDEQTGRELLALLRRVAADEGVTVVLVTHDHRATAHADRAVTVRDGRVTAELSLREARRVAVIDESGLLRLEPDDLAAAGIDGRAELHAQPGALVLRGSLLPASAATPAAAPAVAPAAREDRPGPPTVTTASLTRVFPARAEEVRAVDDLSVSFTAGGFHALTGPSGCGKTTLLHLLAGLDLPTAGSVHVLGLALHELTRELRAAFRREHLAFVPQAGALVARLSAHENVAIALRARGVAADEADGAAADALSEVGLGRLARRAVERLSGGEAQRVALARALAAQPAVLLADEPTANLDQRNAIAIAGLLARIAAERGTTVVCATHDSSVVAAAATVTALDGGRLSPRGALVRPWGDMPATEGTET